MCWRIDNDHHNNNNNNNNNNHHHNNNNNHNHNNNSNNNNNNSRPLLPRPNIPPQYQLVIVVSSTHPGGRYSRLQEVVAAEWDTPYQEVVGEVL